MSKTLTGHLISGAHSALPSTTTMSSRLVPSALKATTSRRIVCGMTRRMSVATAQAVRHASAVSRTPSLIASSSRLAVGSSTTRHAPKLGEWTKVYPRVFAANESSQHAPCSSKPSQLRMTIHLNSFQVYQSWNLVPLSFSTRAPLSPLL